MNLPNFSPLVWILLSSFVGGALSVLLAGLVALNARQHWVSRLVSYAIGALLGAVFLEILPHAFSIQGVSVDGVAATILFGILLFFTLEKLVLWRHCHGDHCEAHAPHDEAHCPQIHPELQDTSAHHAVKFRAVSAPVTPSLHGHSHAQHHAGHDHGRSGLMIMIGDTFHNFVDGVLIAAAFMADIRLGLVTAIAIIAHEIPQEIGDFLILLHSGYSKQKALLLNLISSVATVLGGLLAYLALQQLQQWVPYILSLAAASMLYVAVADLIPGLHRRTAMRDTIEQLVLIVLGVSSILITKWWLEG